MKPLKIVSIASEVAPYSKTGGLADVARSLPKALSRLGHEVVVITPLYEKLINKKKFGLEKIFDNVPVYLNSKEAVTVSFWKGFLMNDLPIYFIENKKYFSKKRSLYGSTHENARFLVFDVSALKLISLLKYPADIVHCHDWHTGLIPFYLKTDFRYSKTLSGAKTIFTIHNLVFQLGHNWWDIPANKKDYGKGRIPHLANPDIEHVNFAKRAIMAADAINTVSEQYREEIMTRHFGQDLHRILRNRKDRLFGIVNGIDYLAYNPRNDPGLYKKYSLKNFQLKRENKHYLQKKLGLAVNPQIPLICTTSRLTFQKGFELIVKLLEVFARMDLQLIIMGDGDKQYIAPCKKFQKLHPKKIVCLPFDQKIETLLYAGSDMFLLPSHHEPCGINQLIAMRYGSIPIVRKVGGLHDTVENYQPTRSRGNGFTFQYFDTYGLYGALVRALETYKDREEWNSLILRAMEKSHSWEIPAKKYIQLYRQVMKNK